MEMMYDLYLGTRFLRDGFRLLGTMSMLMLDSYW